MQLDHTPGNWAVDPNDAYMVTADIDGLIVAITESEDRSDTMAIANAKLIALIPELLAVALLASTVGCHERAVDFLKSRALAVLGKAGIL